MVEGGRLNSLVVRFARVLLMLYFGHMLVVAQETEETKLQQI